MSVWAMEFIWTIFWIGYEFHCGRARMEAVISAHYFGDEVLFLFVYFENSCEIVFLYKCPMELMVINLKLTPRRQYKIDIQRDAIFVRCIANIRFTCNHQVQVPEEGFHQVQQEVEWWFGQEEHWKWLPQDAPLLQSYSCYCPHSGNYH